MLHSPHSLFPKTVPSPRVSGSSSGDSDTVRHRPPLRTLSTHYTLPHLATLLPHSLITTDTSVHPILYVAADCTNIAHKLTRSNNVPTGSPILESGFSPSPPLFHFSTRTQEPDTNYQDLGKSAGDLLQKDYPIQGTSLEVKTLTPSNVAFKVAGVRTEDAQISGDIEGKYVDFKNGLAVTQVSSCLRATGRL